jgi:hypothetical protein
LPAKKVYEVRSRAGVVGEVGRLAKRETFVGALVQFVPFPEI